ncbi:MAG TPA: TRAP transporter small permease [Beijerinckiaceae bacterium]|nr:TRAP transporter small permease [Beijerinckiaceae bacterium]
MIRRYVALVEMLSRAFGVVAVLLLIAAMLVVCQMIFFRYVFRAPTIWQTDFVVYTATAAIFLGAPYVLLTRGHVGVDVIEMVVRPQTRRRMRFAASVLGFLFCASMLYASWIYFHEVWENEWRTSGVWQIPLWMPTLPLPVGFGLLCLQYIAEMLKLKDAAPEATPSHLPP